MECWNIENWGAVPKIVRAWFDPLRPAPHAASSTSGFSVSTIQDSIFPTRIGAK
jgi:hypothetical protein